MRFSKLLTKPQKEGTKEEDLISAKLLLQANFIHKLGSGAYTYLPLGFRVIKKIEEIIREEFDKIDTQEVLSRVVQPSSLWQKSDRLESFGPELVQFKNRQDQDQVLATTHEEAVTDMVKGYLDSYRDLPLIINQIQTKYRDEPRPRGGLIRLREFIMQDAYSFDTDKKGLDKTYNKVKETYRNIFARCGLKTIIVDSYVGAMGGYGGEEFMLLSDQGEDKLIICPGGDYQANVEVAKFEVREDKQKPKKLEKIKTPETKTIEELSNLLDVKPTQTAKMVFYKTDKGIVAVVVRGDLEVNQAKLEDLLKVNELTPASEEEIREIGAEPGYANPNNLKTKTIIDPTVAKTNNLIIGANEEGYHLKNYNYPRDFEGDKKLVEVADIAEARAGLTCPNCPAKLEEKRGIELGHIFKLGKKYSKSFDLKYLDKEGKEQIPEMGCYGIGLDRLMAAVVEKSNDNQGIIWPEEIAPYKYHLITISNDKEVVEFADKVYQKLNKKSDILYDDRDESPGVKFNDADLIGCPTRLVISSKTIKEDKIELSQRGEEKNRLVNLSDLE